GDPTRRGQPTATTSAATTTAPTPRTRCPLAAVAARTRAVTTTPAMTRGRGRDAGARRSASRSAARWACRAARVRGTFDAELVTRPRVSGRARHILAVMARLLLLTHDPGPSSQVVPALGLLGHRVRVLPADASALLDAPDADVVLVD